MWLAILGGVAVGLLVAMFLVLRQERGYRALFSDTHLTELAMTLEAARTGEARPTSLGVAVRWQRKPEHLAIVLEARQPLAPAAAKFLLAFALELVRRAEVTATLQLDRRRYALVFSHAALDAARPIEETTDATLPAIRGHAADQMKALALSQVGAAGLAAYG